MFYNIKGGNGKVQGSLGIDDLKFKVNEVIVPDTEVYATLFDDSPGRLMLTLSTGALCYAFMIDGAISVISVLASASITGDKDNATTFNIYLEDNVIKVQNLTGADVGFKLSRLSHE